MSTGKYSPTVSAAYAVDQGWHKKLSGDGLYDTDGFDSYGYDKGGRDRAGHSEDTYLSNETDLLEEFGSVDHGDTLFDKVLGQWAFDGTRPVKRAIA